MGKRKSPPPTRRRTVAGELEPTGRFTRESIRLTARGRAYLAAEEARREAAEQGAFLAGLCLLAFAVASVRSRPVTVRELDGFERDEIEARGG